jgi:hypothetical protein
LIFPNLNELTAIKSSNISLFLFLSEHYSTADKPEVGKRTAKGKNEKKTIKMFASYFREIFGEQKYITYFFKNHSSVYNFARFKFLKST